MLPSFRVSVKTVRGFLSLYLRLQCPKGVLVLDINLP